MMSIYTCGEPGCCVEERLTRKFGIVGRRLKQMVQGIDDSPMVQFGEEVAVNEDIRQLFAWDKFLRIS